MSKTLLSICVNRNTVSTLTFDIHLLLSLVHLLQSLWWTFILQAHFLSDHHNIPIFVYVHYFISTYKFAMFCFTTVGMPSLNLVIPLLVPVLSPLNGNITNVWFSYFHLSFPLPYALIFFT